MSMKLTFGVYKLLLLVLLSGVVSCNERGEVKNEINKTTINFDHFNYLYKEVDFKKTKAAIIHIYSEYPDYSYAIESQEGFTCVDDVSRAIVLLSNHLTKNGQDEAVYDQLRRLSQFVLGMQHANGYFNNFVWNDLSINTTYKTSVAELNWWSLRALWALESAYPLLSTDKDIQQDIEVASSRLIRNIKRDLDIENTETTIVESIVVPTWLPQKYAADQAALLILGLLKYHDRAHDDESLLIIDSMAKGIKIMQKGGGENFPYGAYLSWGNLWHAWGNAQAYAMLKAGQKLKNPEYVKSALLEIDNYYPYLLQHGFAEAIWIERQGADEYVEIKRNSYPQIAYGLRPMIWATNEAYRNTKDEKYKTLSLKLESWLTGDNVANTAMYDPSSGICFDGIISATKVNKNSGAESTIESLLIWINKL